MKQVFYSTLLILSIVISACSSGEKALQKGNYYSAVLKSVDRLRSNPDKSKAQQTLLESYPLAVQWSKREIVSILNSLDPMKNTKSIGQYQILNRMYDEINRCPAAYVYFLMYNRFVPKKIRPDSLLLPNATRLV